MCFHKRTHTFVFGLSAAVLVLLTIFATVVSRNFNHCFLKCSFACTHKLHTCVAQGSRTASFLSRRSLLRERKKPPTETQILDWLIQVMNV
jgi:hypothetical protein